MRVHHIVRGYLYYRYIQSWMAVIDIKTHDRTTYTFMEVIEIIVFKYDFICTRGTLFEYIGSKAPGPGHQYPQCWPNIHCDGQEILHL